MTEHLGHAKNQSDPERDSTKVRNGSGERRLVEDRAPGDDHPRVDERPEPVEWVRVEHDQVGSLAGLDRPRDVLQAQDLRVGPSRSIQRLGGGRGSPNPAPLRGARRGGPARRRTRSAAPSGYGYLPYLGMRAGAAGAGAPQTAAAEGGGPRGTVVRARRRAPGRGAARTRKPLQQRLGEFGKAKHHGKGPDQRVIVIHRGERRAEPFQHPAHVAIQRTLLVGQVTGPDRPHSHGDHFSPVRIARRASPLTAAVATSRITFPSPAARKRDRVGAMVRLLPIVPLLYSGVTLEAVRHVVWMPGSSGHSVRTLLVAGGRPIRHACRCGYSIWSGAK
jgi:hypothetical protein